MTPIELVAFCLGVINVTLVARRSLWNYPFGLATVALYAWIFLGAKLYSDALLQVFFFVVQVYGWVNWARSAARAGEVEVRRLTGWEWPLWLTGSLLVTAAWGALMHRFTDAAFPWWDGAVAVLSVAAQVLMSRRVLDNWVLWIAVDLLAIGLYAAKGLWLTAVLYAIFLGLSVWGLAAWRAAGRQATG